MSLIMPVWRPRPEWLIQAVESALGQRGCRLELVLVDDGCPTPVEDLLAEIRDPRLHILRVEHGGSSRARNAGFAAARGSRIRFVDCDDVLEPDSTARLLRLMGSDDDVIAYGATLVCDERLRPRRLIASGIQGPAEIACLLNRFTVMLPAILFPRWVVETAGEWNPALPVCQDWDFVLRALEHAPARGERAVALLYRRHRASSSHDAEAGWRATLAVVAGYLERHPEVRGTPLEVRVRRMLDILRLERAAGGRPWRSLRFWRAALRDPVLGLATLRSSMRRSSAARWWRLCGRWLGRMPREVAWGASGTGPAGIER